MNAVGIRDLAEGVSSADDLYSIRSPNEILDLFYRVRREKLSRLKCYVSGPVGCRLLAILPFGMHLLFHAGKLRDYTPRNPSRVIFRG